MKKGIINHSTKGIFITTFAKVIEDGVKRDPTVEEMNAEMAKVAAGIDSDNPPTFYLVDEKNVPADETATAFFQALVYEPETNSFGYDLAKARDVRLEQLRFMRKDLFPLVDTMRAKATETGVGMENVTNLANKLRDMPADAVADLENLGDVQSIASYLPSVFGELVAGQ